MAKFKYKALRQGGEKYEAEMEADNRFAVYSAIRKEGGVFLDLQEIKSKPKGPLNLRLPKFLNKVGTNDKIQFAKNLGAMIDAGLPVTRGISVIERQTKKVVFKKILAELGADISKGDSLSTAMGKHPDVFPPLFMSMVKAGEESGGVSRSLKAVGGQLEKSYVLTKKIRGAMIYPAIIISVMIVIALAMLIFVVPTISAVFKDLHADLPITTKIVIASSDFLRNHYLISLASVLIIWIAGLSYLRTKQGRRFKDDMILRLPIIGQIVKQTNAARTARTLTSLLSSGVDILVAIKITEDVVQNVFYKEVLAKAELAVEKGKPISTVFIAEEKLYPAFVGEMTDIGEEAGKLGEMLENVATFYENEVEQKTKDLSTIIEPFLMVAVGIAVGFFAISMLSPIYSLVNNF